MTKRVHFAADNATYSLPSTPSPSTSLSSLPSDSLSAPSTPPLVTPATVYPRSPYALKPSPLPKSAPPDEMHIHFLLAFAPYGAPAVRYSLSVSPLILLEDQVSHEAFSDPATEPPLSSLTIQLPNLPWPLEVTPSSNAKRAYVTVSDVFHALYTDLRLCAHPTEYNGLSGTDAREVDMAYFGRCRNAGADKQRQLEKGIKKVDFLMGKTRFLGLSATLQAADVWELNVA